MKPYILILAALALAVSISAATYEVGPGGKLAGLNQVPWESLQPGDTVLIHARNEPYRSKFVLCRAGKPDAPITVRGVPDAEGHLPVLDGDGATTRKTLRFWGGDRSVIKIGGAENPPDTTPAYIVIENLEVRGARRPHQFADADGKVVNFAKNAAAIRVEKGEHITLRSCVLTDSGNGLFISSTDKQATRDVLVEGCHIFGNGNPKSGQEHNIYSEAIGLVFQYNRLGPLRADALGNNLKDRSAGLVVRYNWIEGGNKELDLVDAEDSALVRRDPGYREALVCGNIFLKLPADGHALLVHCGGDSKRPDNYRKGLLRFHNNTIISYRTGTTTLFKFSSDDERCDFRNNIVHLAAPKAALALVENAGRVEMTRNWFNSGWQKMLNPKGTARFNGDGIFFVGSEPGFVDAAAQNFRLNPDSPCLGVGAAMGVDRQYVKHQSAEMRPDGIRPDIGAQSSPRSVKPSSSSPR